MKIVEVKFTQSGSKIVTFTRDKEGNRVKRYHDFEHYIYVEDPDGDHKTLFGDRCSKMYVEKFWEAKKLVEGLEKETYEDDITYTKRFLLDHGHEIKSEGKPRVLFYDIETTGFDSQECEIISIVACDSYTGQFYDFIWAPDLKVTTEKEMLKDFARLVEKLNPDILTGWNSDRFDLPFLYNRFQINGVATKLLSPLRQEIKPFYTGTEHQYRIRGRVVFDFLKAYKKMHYGELDSYALDFVAHEELGVGKIDINRLPGELWKDGLYDELLRYNRRDVEIMWELDKKLGIIEFFDTLATIAEIDFHDTIHNSRIVDSYILKYTTERGIILPSKRYGNKRTQYTGAKVLDPIKGIHENIGVFDLASLYPSIIISFNLSPETMSDSNRAKKPAGLVPILLEDLFILRREYRSQGRDNEQRVVKEIMNSFYGVMAFPSFRLYKKEMASEITKHGREIIEFTRDTVIDSGYDVIYGDTDSVFVAGIPNSESASELEGNINSVYDKYAESHNLDSHRLRIEFEAFASRGIMVKKKRYALKLENDYKIRGFQMVRSDTQKLTKEMQETILHMILDGSSKKEINQYYEQMQGRVFKKEIDTSDIGIPRKFVKKLDDYADSTAVRGAKYSNEYLKKNIGAGDKCVLYHIKRVAEHQEPTDAIALEYGDEVPRGYIVNIKKHWERIDKALKPLLEDLEINQETKQMSIMDFIGKQKDLYME